MKFTIYFLKMHFKTQYFFYLYTRSPPPYFIAQNPIYVTFRGIFYMFLEKLKKVINNFKVFDKFNELEKLQLVNFFNFLKTNNFTISNKHNYFSIFDKFNNCNIDCLIVSKTTPLNYINGVLSHKRNQPMLIIHCFNNCSHFAFSKLHPYNRNKLIASLSNINNFLFFDKKK